MKYIKFADEVLSVPEQVTFWVMNRGSDYQAQYCVNMSELKKQNFIGEPDIDTIIRSEGYVTKEEAYARLNEIFFDLNDIPMIEDNFKDAL